MGLKLKISSGYLLLMFVLASIICLYQGEELKKDALKKEESELTDLHNLSQRVYTSLLDLSSQSEIVIAWTDEDFDNYRTKLGSLHATLKILKGYIHTPQQQARIDSFHLLLDEKSQLLAAVMTTFNEEGDMSEIVSKKIPAIVSQVQREQVPLAHPVEASNVVVEGKSEQQKKRKNIWNIFKKKKIESAYHKQKEQGVVTQKNEVKEVREDKMVKNTHLSTTVPLLHNLTQEVAEKQKTQRERLFLQMDSLYDTNQILNVRFNTLIGDFEREANQHLSQRYEKLKQRREQSSNIIACLSVSVFLFAVILYILVHRDINKRNQYERALKIADQNNKELLQSRKKMMLTISHDIRGPLNTIICSAELATDTREKKKRNKHLEHIKDSCNYILNLVNNLLDIYRLNESKEMRNDLPFRLETFMERITAGFTLQANNKGLMFTTDFSGINVIVRGDADRIEQIIGNLLANAIKFTISGTVSCKADYMGGKLILEISDTGIGMDAEAVNSIFIPFERIASPLNVDGFGLGLAITNGLVNLLEGTIRVASVPGKGSCFTVTLPLPETLEKIEEEIHVPEVPGWLPHWVLVIDDDPLQLEITKEILERSGITCRACHHVKEVVNELRQTQYDLLLTDMQMPGTNGVELLQLLRSSNIENSKTIPMAAMTARGDMDKDSFTEIGFAGCIHKPFSTKELLDFLSTLMVEEKKKECYHTDFTTLTAGMGSKYKMLKLFIRESEENISELEKALQDNDCKRMRETVHRMMPVWEMLKEDEILRDYQSTLHNEKISADAICERTKRVISYTRELTKEALNEIMFLDDETENLDSRG